ncbi:hypothetical protein LTR10_008359 [Elasticomyces elasticus]|nr:hypothetical protein LTR10_008359 [Elasticomyces elasticus]KAK4967233.1 hypothetical protein LTR42_010582 [Elasticomyces elasticus]
MTRGIVRSERTFAKMNADMAETEICVARLECETPVLQLQLGSDMDIIQKIFTSYMKGDRTTPGNEAAFVLGIRAVLTLAGTLIWRTFESIIGSDVYTARQLFGIAEWTQLVDAAAAIAIGKD